MLPELKSTYSLVKSMKSEELSDRPCLLSLCLVPPHLISPENVAKYSRVPSRDESNTKHRIHVLTLFGNFWTGNPEIELIPKK